MLFVLCAFSARSIANRVILEKYGCKSDNLQAAQNALDDLKTLSEEHASGPGCFDFVRTPTGDPWFILIIVRGR